MEMKIVDMQRSTQSGCVTTAHWIASKTDGDYTASAYGSIGLPAKDPSDPTFIPFEQLTEAEVVDWVKEVMGEEQVAALEVNLNGQIEAQRHPTVASGVPWASAFAPDLGFDAR
jgi:hypothetical protein